MPSFISAEIVTSKILFIRGKKVMIDKDLAGLYGVSTKRLNEQVKRNIKRFPEDFMFQLTRRERDKVVAICDHLKSIKFSYQMPYVFTEQGVAMLSSILNSERAIQVNIMIMRAFVKLRQILATHKGFTLQLEALEKKYTDHDNKIKLIFDAIKQLLEPKIIVKKKRVIGFHP